MFFSAFSPICSNPKETNDTKETLFTPFFIVTFSLFKFPVSCSVYIDKQMRKRRTLINPISGNDTCFYDKKRK